MSQAHTMARRILRKAGHVLSTLGTPPPPPAVVATPPTSLTPPDAQNLDVYFDPVMADILETWGKDHVWKEIRLLAAPLNGRFLDIACGTGTVMQILRDELKQEVIGCDIAKPLLDN